MTFQGYLRPNGSAGVRNEVAIIPAIQCANELADRIAKNCEGAVALTHNFMCTYVGKDKERAVESIISLGASPNLFGCLIVGIGCDPVSADEIAKRINEAGGNASSISITTECGYDETVEKASAIVKNLLKDAAKEQRVPCDLSKLVIGVRCGGSGAISAITSNAATGAAVDLLVKNGATIIFSETAEIIGADKVLAKRAATPEVAEKLTNMVCSTLKRINDNGVDILGSEPSPGNIKQGLTTIEEKSMGAIVKSGTTPLLDVLNYGEKPVKGSGVYFMDGSAMSPFLFMGMIMAGAQMQIFSYGGGLPARARMLSTFPSYIPSYPVVKIMGSPEDEDVANYFDVYGGKIVSGEKSIDQVGQELFEKVIAVASGEKSWAETYTTYREMIQFYKDGLIL